MKKSVLVKVCIMAAAMLIFAPTLMSCSESVQSAVPAAQNSTITVHASDVVSAAPDIAYVNLGVRSGGTTAQEAQQENADAAVKLLNAIKGRGIVDADIETSRLNVYQDYENPNRYIAETSYRVTVRDMTTVGSLIDDAVNAGANMSYSLSFDIEDKSGLYLDALANAVKSAQQKAQSLAEAGGYRITEVRSIEENSGGYYSIDSVTYAEAAMDTAGYGAAVAVPDEITVNADVTGIFAITAD